MFGMGNRCNGGLYVLFLDYDGTPIEWVLEEVRMLQERYRGLLGSAYLFRTKHGVHVVFLEKHPIGEIVEMMRLTSCDLQYQHVPMKYARRVWVLRQSPKKDEQLEYYGVVPSEIKGVVDRSRAHKLWMKANYSIPEKDFERGGTFDLETDIIVGHYHVSDK